MDQNIPLADQQENQIALLAYHSPLLHSQPLIKEGLGDAETIFKAFVLWSQMPGAFEDGKAAIIGELVREMM